jgi:protein-tyrosine phosphatase
VKVIVDLRAEDLEVDRAGIEALGMKLVRIPMRDGQAPTDEQVQKFLTVMKNADGRVYVHCGAGVGRTGTMAASYLVLTGKASGAEAVQRNLAIGPPSLEQIAFAASLDEGEEAGGFSPLTVVSRVLDAPRRLLVRVRHSYQ